MPSICPICDIGVTQQTLSISCSICYTFYHYSCLDISFESFKINNKPGTNWICPDHSKNMPIRPKIAVQSNSGKPNKTLTI